MGVNPRFVGYILIAGTALAAVTACSGEVAGAPRPVEVVTNTETVPSSVTSTPTEQPSVEEELAALDPCSLLTDAERADLELSAGEPDDVGGGIGCRWRGPEESSGGIIWATRGFDDLNAEGRTVTDLSIGGRDARMLENDVGGVCSVDLAVTPSSTVTTTTVHDDADFACARAEQLARLIEPKLPKGQ